LDALLVFGLLVAIVILLATERLRPDLVAMVATVALVGLGLLPAEHALSGFSNPATITVACMFVLSAGLESSGFVRLLGDLVERRGPSSESGLLLLLAVVVAPLSAFINNTAAVAVFLPVVQHTCEAKGLSPSRLMMPMAFLAILGGSCTLIGSSTNILVSAMAAERGLAPIGMFEVTGIGLLFLGIGTVYLLGAGRFLLPRRIEPTRLTDRHRLNRYLFEIVIQPGSPLDGLTLRDARLGEQLDVEVLGIAESGDGELETLPSQDLRLHEGQVLLVKASAEVVARLRTHAGVAIRATLHQDHAHLQSVDTAMIEVVVGANSALDGRTLKGVNFRRQYGATVLAIRRQGVEIREKIGRVRLQVGDELLVLAARHGLAELKLQRDFIVLQEVEHEALHPFRASVAGGIVTAVVVLAATGVYPVVGAALFGAVAMVLTGCVPARTVYRSIHWQVVVLLAGLIPVGIALETSGAAAQMIDGVMWALGDLGPRAVLAGFVLLTYLLTGIMSNNATAALMVPLAIGSAATMGVDARPFLIAIMISASAAFWTPIGYQTNLLVYGPGGYRFADYVRAGGPLNLIYLVLSAVLIPMLFPL
jgi:di/tricarboxylate transporter